MSVPPDMVVMTIWEFLLQDTAVVQVTVMVMEAVTRMCAQEAAVQVIIKGHHKLDQVKGV
jgi:hypothetical protein